MAGPSPFPPLIRYLVVPAGRTPDDIAVNAFATLAAARNQVEYWQRLLPDGEPQQIIEAVTAYTAVEPQRPDVAVQPQRIRSR